LRDEQDRRLAERTPGGNYGTLGQISREKRQGCQPLIYGTLVRILTRLWPLARGETNQSRSVRTAHVLRKQARRPLP
jgi:hypothetical protein